MTALQFLNIFSETRKIESLNNMPEKEKGNLINDLKKLIVNYWSQCQSSTVIKLQREFSNINDEIMYLDNMLSFIDWTKIKYDYNLNKTQRSIFQWSIFYCELGHNLGSEKNKTRPVLILQDMRDYLNSGTVLIAPITTGSNAQFPHEIIIDATEKNKIKGIVDLSHIRSVSRSRLDPTPKDRLLNENEYKRYYGNAEYITVQTKVKKVKKVN